MQSPNAISEVLDDHADEITGQLAEIPVNGSNLSILEDEDDQDYFAVTLQAGHEYEFKVKGYPSSSDGDFVLLRLQYQDGTVIHSTGDSSYTWVAYADWVPAVDGIYYLSIDADPGIGIDYPGIYGRFEVSVNDLGTADVIGGGLSDDHGNDRATASTLSVGDIAAGGFETYSDSDWFSVELVAGQSYAFSMTGGSHSQYFRIADQSGFVDYSDFDFYEHSALAQIFYTPEVTGTYYLPVSHSPADLKGLNNYELVIAQILTDDYAERGNTTGILPLDTVVGGVIDFAYDEDWFRIDLEAGTAYDFRITGLQAPKVAVEGSFLQDDTLFYNRNWYEDEKTLSFVALETGSYTFQIEGGDETDTGAYEILAQVDPTGGHDPLPIYGRPFDDAISAKSDYMENVFDLNQPFTLVGLEGNDTLYGAGGNDRLFGEDFHASYAPDYSWQVYRLYQAALGREPDGIGHKDWTLRLDAKELTLVEAAARFVASPEFQITYGALSDDQFVELLYQNVLDRAADSGGKQSWLDRLDGGLSRAGVVTGFSESQEFIAKTMAGAAGFDSSHTPVTWSDEVFRVYRATLDRDPDFNGFLNWVDRLAAGAELETVVSGFVGSQEFQNTYGALNADQFVELLYGNVLGRASDVAGKQGWLDRMTNGASRESVVLGFSESQEFIANTTGILETWMLGLGPDDELHGKAGLNILAGGLLSDKFIFDFDDFTGTNRILDYEPWDVLEFRNFGYNSEDEVRARMYQDGDDVSYYDWGIEVIIEDTTLADITGDILFS